jgi:hypothetical protein
MTLTDLCPSAGDHDVTAQQEFKPAGAGNAVHRGDHRFGMTFETAK